MYDFPAGPRVRHPAFSARTQGRNFPVVAPVLALILTALVVLAVLSAGAARAQTAGQITPPDLAPPAQRLSGSIVFSGAAGLQAPAGADQLSILLRSVQVDGTLPGMQPATQALEAQLTGGRIPVSRIFTAAQALQAAYAKAGYVLARVVLPAQTLRDGGSLRLTVVNGFVEKIDVSNVPEPVRSRLQVLTAPLIGQKGLKLDRIERSLLLAGDTYGVALGSALSAGATPGGTVIVLQPQFRKVTGFVGFDNGYSKSLGAGSLSAGLEFNGLLGLGEAFYIRGSGHPDPDADGPSGSILSDTPRLRTLAVGAVFPLGTRGLTFNIEATRSQTNPRNQPSDSSSEFHRLSGRLFYPLVRSRSLNVTGQLSLDINQDSLDVMSTAGRLPIYRDRLRVLRGAVDSTWVRPGGAVIEAGAILSFGLDGFGARSASDATPTLPLSRAGADAAFQKLELSGRYRRRLGQHFGLSVAGRGQYAFGDALVSSEQIDLAGPQDLSAFASGTLSGDAGWLVRAELSAPFDRKTKPWPMTVSPYVFAAGGAAYLAQPGAGEDGTVRAGALGLGVDLTAVRDPKFSTASLRLELAKGYRSDDGSDDLRVSVVGTFRF